MGSRGAHVLRGASRPRPRRLGRRAHGQLRLRTRAHSPKTMSACSAHSCGVGVQQSRIAPSSTYAILLKPVGAAIAELILVNACSDQKEWNGQVVYLPL